MFKFTCRTALENMISFYLFSIFGDLYLDMGTPPILEVNLCNLQVFDETWDDYNDYCDFVFLWVFFCVHCFRGRPKINKLFCNFILSLRAALGNQF